MPNRMERGEHRVPRCARPSVRYLAPESYHSANLQVSTGIFTHQPWRPGSVRLGS